MSSPKALAVRLAEAAHGAKWTAATAAGSKLAELKRRFPDLAPVFDTLGLTEDMDAAAMNAHLKKTLVCDKKAAKAVRAARQSGPVPCPVPHTPAPEARPFGQTPCEMPPYRAHDRSSRWLPTATWWRRPRRWERSRA